MGVEGFDHEPFGMLNSRTGDALTHIPVTPEEGLGSAVEPVWLQARFHDRPARKNGKACAENAAIVEV